LLAQSVLARDPGVRAPLISHRHERAIPARDLDVPFLVDALGGEGTLVFEPPGDGPVIGGCLILPRPLLRVTLRGSVLTARALGPRGACLLPAVVSCLGRPLSGDRVCFSTIVEEASKDPARSDGERLRSPSFLDPLRRLLALFREEDPGLFPVCLAGALGHDLVDHLEELPPRPPDPVAEPDLDLVLGADAILLDRRGGRAVVVTRGLETDLQDPRQRLEEWIHALECAPGEPRQHAPQNGSREDLPGFSADLTDEEFESGVSTLLHRIRCGDVFQAVLSRRLTVESRARSLDVFRHLRSLEAASYRFFFRCQEGELLGASPESYLTVKGDHAGLTPIAGTVERRNDVEEDGRLAVALLLDRKEQAEHAMLVDLARNDLARISVPGTRRLERSFHVEPYGCVQHIVSRVGGTLAPGIDAFSAYRGCIGPGTLTGAPKLRALELLRGIEKTGRGFYGGALAVFTASGDLESCIVIRSIRMTAGQAIVRSGAGIVRDSVPSRELAETLAKARTPLLALARAGSTAS